jgi:hypothetical protein
MQLSPLAYNSLIEHEDSKRALEAIVSAYSPGSTAYKFQHLFLNVVDNPAQRLKPGQVADELSWKQALRDAGGPDNPDRWVRGVTQERASECCTPGSCG